METESTKLEQRRAIAGDESTIMDVTMSSRSSYNECTKKEQDFIDGIVLKGYNRVEAYLEANYAKNNAKALSRKIFWRVRSIIEQELEHRLQSAAPLAMKTLIELMTGAKSETLRFKAAQDVLNRTGYVEIRKIEIKDTSDKTDQELDQEISALMQKATETALKTMH